MSLMRSVSNVSFWYSPWGISIGAHAGFFAVVGLILFPWKRSSEQIDFEVYESPRLATQAPLVLSKPVELKKEAAKRSVFGVSRKSVSDSTGDSQAPVVKLGNTVAKNTDSDILRADDADSIPIPTEEYLVTAMPVLVSDFRIPYPPEARKAKIQGRVLMKLLIDGEGKVRRALLISGPGFGLNEAAVAAMNRFQFRPARVQDRPVAVEIQFAYNFVLER